MTSTSFVDITGQAHVLRLDMLVQRMANRLLSLEKGQPADAVLIFREGESGFEVQLGPCDGRPRIIALAPTMEGSVWASYAHLRDQLAVAEGAEAAAWSECH